MVVSAVSRTLAVAANDGFASVCPESDWSTLGLNKILVKKWGWVGLPAHFLY
jgi:hypothetical protein